LMYGVSSFLCCLAEATTLQSLCLNSDKSCSCHNNWSVHNFWVSLYCFCSFCCSFSASARSSVVILRQSSKSSQLYCSSESTRDFNVGSLFLAGADIFAATEHLFFNEGGISWDASGDTDGDTIHLFVGHSEA
jgi:hypothetical protein